VTKVSSVFCVCDVAFSVFWERNKFEGYQRKREKPAKALQELFVCKFAILAGTLVKLFFFSFFGNNVQTDTFWKVHS
jgi:hypothetical protein